ncbi:MAG: hypothetical protein ACYDC8_09685 [Gammaproteobacteria bacterium]
MNISGMRLRSLTIVGLLLLGGCASHPPTIAHTHIGHVLTGWWDTPNQEGLFVAAEKSAQVALQAAESATASGNDLGQIKSGVARVVVATDPTDDHPDAQGKIVYGVKNALRGAVDHVRFAVESPDVSANLKASAPQFIQDANTVLDRCGLIKALGNDIVHSSSPEEGKLLSQELLKLTRANLFGDDPKGDGVVGSSPKEYGLKQLRAELQAMIDRENPPYTTVDSWYLLNLVRLPSGVWIFRQRSSTGGGYGGY